MASGLGRSSNGWRPQVVTTLCGCNNTTAELNNWADRRGRSVLRSASGRFASVQTCSNLDRLTGARGLHLLWYTLWRVHRVDSRLASRSGTEIARPRSQRRAPAPLAAGLQRAPLHRCNCAGLANPRTAGRKYHELLTHGLRCLAACAFHGAGLGDGRHKRAAACVMDRTVPVVRVGPRVGEWCRRKRRAAGAGVRRRKPRQPASNSRRMWSSVAGAFVTGQQRRWPTHPKMHG